MSVIEQSIDVSVPVSTAYNQWTQFEEFPRFMEGVERVQQLDDTRLHWVAEIGGQRREWEAKILEQQPDRVISWTSTDAEVQNAGTVMFEPIGGDQTRVSLRMEVNPTDFVEKTGDALGLIERRVRGDLERFKEFIETRGRETGAWRGEVEGGRETRSA